MLFTCPCLQTPVPISGQSRLCVAYFQHEINSYFTVCKAKEKTDLKIMAAIRKQANQQTHASFMYGIVTAHCPWKLIGMKWQAWGLQSAVHCNKAPEQNIYVSLAKWQQMISVFQLDGGTWNVCDKQAWAGSIMKCKFSGSGSELGQWGCARVGRGVRGRRGESPCPGLYLSLRVLLANCYDIWCVMPLPCSLRTSSFFNNLTAWKGNAYTTMPFWTLSDGPIGAWQKNTLISLRDHINIGLG